MQETGDDLVRESGLEVGNSALPERWPNGHCFLKAFSEGKIHEKKKKKESLSSSVLENLVR